MDPPNHIQLKLISLMWINGFWKNFSWVCARCSEFKADIGRYPTVLLTIGTYRTHTFQKLNAVILRRVGKGCECAAPHPTRHQIQLRLIYQTKMLLLGMWLSPKHVNFNSNFLRYSSTIFFSLVIFRGSKLFPFFQNQSYYWYSLSLCHMMPWF